MAQLVLTKAFLQPAKIAAMYCHPEGDIHPSPPILPFLLVQNLFSKWIAPTDNNWPKLHDEYVPRNFEIVLRILRIPKLRRESRDCVNHMCAISRSLAPVRMPDSG